MIDFKANYFFSKKKESNPFYLTGGIAASIQRVHEELINYYYAPDTGSQINRYLNMTELMTYNRFLIGPEFGVGMFLAFGRVSFQSELIYSARFSPFIDRSYRELSFNLFNGLVYKF